GNPEVTRVLLRTATDTSRLVRSETGFALRWLDLGPLDVAERAGVEAVFAEYLAAQGMYAELDEPWFNRGVFHAARGEVARAEDAYRLALSRWPGNLSARHNLAALLARDGREDDA